MMKRNSWRYRGVRTLLMAALLAVPVSLPPSGPAYALCCKCEKAVEKTEKKQWEDTLEKINKHIETEFTALKIWWAQLFLEDNILPALMMMSDQLTAVGMEQMFAIGTFVDAKFQMETQQVMQEMNARTHKDYHPSMGMCVMGTQVKSLAASERKGEIGAFFMSQRVQDRNLGNQSSSASAGEDMDKAGRLEHFRQKFCEPKDNNDGLGNLCSGGIKKLRNADLDYVRMVELPWTLDADFTDNQKTNEEEALMALQSNLFSHTVFKLPTGDSLASVPGEEVTPLQRRYQDARSIAAKRSVAQNSFGAIVSMKTEGAPEAREYLIKVIQDLGLSQQEAELLSGKAQFEGKQPNWKKISPSYYAQMEVLTKKIYQNPDFYTNLYDKPANVDRKGVALQAINLMQKFDFLKSLLRSEASWSVLLELGLMDVQEEIETEMGKQKSGGRPATP
ncbi:MAG: hypothetical protein K9G62_03370 [Alphaproteobacteria bacterium]|nr:hypothetical protein [Alphaproteobacteria bacterium]